MSFVVIVVAHTIDIVHFISCILIILIIYKTNKLKDHQEQLLALQNLAELFYEGVHIISRSPPLYNFKMLESAEKALSIATTILLTLSLQILALLAIVLAISITQALRYKMIVTKRRIYMALVGLCLADIFVGLMFYLPGIQSLDHLAHEEECDEIVSFESNAFYLFVFCYQILPPLVIQFVGVYKVSRFARWHANGFISRRINVYMRRAKLILVICIMLYISYIPHKVLDTFLHFAHERTGIMNTLTMVSSFFPDIYHVSKLPVFLICYMPYRITAMSLVWRTKNPVRVHPSSTCCN